MIVANIGTCAQGKSCANFPLSVSQTPRAAVKPFQQPAPASAEPGCAATHLLLNQPNNLIFQARIEQRKLSQPLQPTHAQRNTRVFGQYLKKLGGARDVR